MALVVRGGLGGVERDLGERLALPCSSMKRIASCAFGVSQNVLTTRSALARRRMFLIRLIDDPVPPTWTDMISEGDEHDQLDDVVARVGEHFVQQVVDAHLLQGVGVEPPVAAAVVVSCSMTLTFGCRGKE